MPHLLRYLANGMYFCAEPYVTITVRVWDAVERKQVKQITHLGTWSAVEQAADATPYPSAAAAKRAAVAQGLTSKQWEVVS